MGEPMTNTQNLTPGWYRDPGSPSEHRYWDGDSWIGPVGETSRLPRQAVARDTVTEAQTQTS